MVKRAFKTLIICFIFFVSSCSESSISTIELLSSQVKKSNETISNNTTNLIDEFNNLKHEPKNWPRALLLEHIIDSIKIIVKLSIDSIKNTENLNTNKNLIISALQINENLKTCLDSFIAKSYLSNADIGNLTNILIIDSSNYYNLKHLNNFSKQQLQSIISSLLNSILCFQNNFMQYCNYTISNRGCGYDKFTTILNQNTKHLKNGELLEISASINLISIAVKPKITINGKVYKSNEEGEVNFNIIAKGKPGNYKVPFKIEYLRPDGTFGKDKMEVSYTIVE